MADKVCYSNNGHSLHWVADDYQPAAGEQLFDEIQTPEQLGEVFDNYDVEARRNDILRTICLLETEGNTPRRIREATTTDAGKQWMAALDAQIAACRKQLP